MRNRNFNFQLTRSGKAACYKTFTFLSFDKEVISADRKGLECVGLPQQVRAARRRVLYVRNCETLEHVAARRRAIRLSLFINSIPVFCVFDGITFFCNFRADCVGGRIVLY